MSRVLPVCAALWLSAAVCEGGGPEPTETVTRLTVQAAPEPKPALRYQLLPELAEMNPGNALPGYLKCFMEQNNFWFQKESVDNREKWQSMPLKDLPRKELVGYGYGKGPGPLNLADDAARLESMDWQALLPLRKQGINLLLPEMHPMRTLAAALRVRFRLEIAERRFDDAIATAKTLLALSRHLGEHPTLIGDLVGMAVASVTLESLVELVEQPGSPNLYWALTALPQPLIDLRKGVQGERVFLAGEFRDIDTRAPMGEAALQKVVARAHLLFQLSNERTQKVRDTRAWLAERTGNAETVAAARQRLVEYGLDAATVKQFPDLQVILLDERFLCEARRDSAEKLLALPFWQAKALLDALPPLDKGTTLYADLVPAYFKVQQSQARVQRRIAMLRCVEGLRLYAAAHQGKLPATLAEVPVPLPVDPVTGRAFGYSLQGGTATLRGLPPAGMEKNAVFNVRYEITIAR